MHWLLDMLLDKVLFLSQVQDTSNVANTLTKRVPCPYLPVLGASTPFHQGRGATSPAPAELSHVVGLHNVIPVTPSRLSLSPVMCSA